VLGTSRTARVGQTAAEMMGVLPEPASGVAGVCLVAGGVAISGLRLVSVR
jgi:hypothetical protein